MRTLIQDIRYGVRTLLRKPGFTVAAIVFLLAGVFIWRRRHQFFDRDSNVENDVPVVRHNREEEIMFVWGGLMLVLLAILYQVWSA